MSTIHDALNKARKENQSEFRSEFLNKKHPTNWGPLFVLLVLLLITAPILAPMFTLPFKNAGPSGQASKSKTAAAVPATKNVNAQFAIEEAPLASFNGPAMPNLALNGIVFSPTNHNDSYCLINGKIIKVGEGVEGAKLIKVTPDEVTLEYRGQTIKLAVTA